jgi:hypothetical protein
MPPAWAQKYDITQEYDKNGNRTRLHRNTADTSTYGRQLDLSYTFDNVNALTAMAFMVFLAALALSH